MKEKVALIHPIFDNIGGAEILALTAADFIARNGYDVTLITGTNINKEKVKAILGIDLSGTKIITINSKIANFLANLSSNGALRLRRVAVIRKILSKKVFNQLKENYDLTIETQSNLPTPFDITYIHFPATIGTKHKMSFIEKTYDIMVSRYSSKLTKTRPGKTLTNSKWTANKIYKEFGIIPDVLYPPVDVNEFSKFAFKEHNEKNVITLSRFSPEKRLDKIIDIAKNFPDFNFYLVGSTTPKLSENILTTLKNKINNEQINNVNLIPDLPRNELMKLMGESKIYLHPPFAEHFGISIVEAMSAGLIPVVYKDGGAWTDIVSNIDSNLGYNESTMKNTLIYAIRNEERLREKSIEFSKNFSKEKFESKFLNIIKYVLEIKRIK